MSSRPRPSAARAGWRDNPRLLGLLGLTAALAAAVLVVYRPGCRTYPAVTSPESLRLMQLLFSACTAEDPVRLTRVEEGAAELAQQGKLSPAEQAAFAHIVGLARGGDWEAARQAALQFAEDQVGQGRRNDER